MGTGEFNAGGNPAMDKHPLQGDKHRPGGPLGPYADFLPYTVPIIHSNLHPGPSWRIFDILNQWRRYR